MAIVLNLLALVLVVGISWLGMLWLAGRVHGHAPPEEAEVDAGDPGDPCPACGGIGATQKLSGIEPCPICEGTGVASM